MSTTTRNSTLQKNNLFWHPPAGMAWLQNGDVDTSEMSEDEKWGIEAARKAFERARVAIETERNTPPWEKE